MSTVSFKPQYCKLGVTELFERLTGETWVVPLLPTSPVFLLIRVQERDLPEGQFPVQFPVGFSE